MLNPVKSHQECMMGQEFLTVVTLEMWYGFGSCIDYPWYICDSSNNQGGCCFMLATDTILKYRYNGLKLGKNYGPRGAH